MDHRASARIRGFGTSIFTEMSHLAQQHQAINLGQGFPDFPGPAFVKEAAARAIAADLNQYAPAPGTLRLRAAIATAWERCHGWPVDPEREVTVTCGATEAIFAALQALLGPGDEVVTFEPCYDSYRPAALLAGAHLRPVPLRPPDWRFDPAELAATVRPTTKVLLLNTPHNPTGKVFSRSELTTIAEVCVERDLIAITDEVYDRMIYDDRHHVALASLPGMRNRTLTINSTGKSFSLTGWKVGYAVGPPPLTAVLRAVHQFVTFAAATPLQEAMATALETAQATDYYRGLTRDYQRRRDLLQTAVAASGLRPLAVAGSYFLLADVSGLGFTDDAAFCRWLTTDVGVAAVPISAFYADPRTAPHLARFCFAKREETIALAADRLARLPRVLGPGWAAAGTGAEGPV